MIKAVVLRLRLTLVMPLERWYSGMRRSLMARVRFREVELMLWKEMRPSGRSVVRSTLRMKV